MIQSLNCKDRQSNIGIARNASHYFHEKVRKSIIPSHPVGYCFCVGLIIDLVFPNQTIILLHMLRSWFCRGENFPVSLFDKLHQSISPFIKF